jgi:hypothetical protein
MSGAGGGMKKSSNEALALIMKNIKKNEQSKKAAWVPNGVKTNPN